MPGRTPNFVVRPFGVVRHEAKASHYIRNSPSPSYLKRGTHWCPSGVLPPGSRIFVDGGAGM